MTIMVGAGGGGRGTRPPSRPAYRPPPSVPIRTLVNPVPYSRGNVPIRQVVNPVTPYRPPARSGGIAHAIGGAVREVSHALAPVARSAANSTRSPASATTQRLARALGSPAPVFKRTLANPALIRAEIQAFGGPDRAFMLPLDPIQSIRGARTQNIIKGKLETMGQFNQDFKNLLDAGLLPKGAKQPPIVFPGHGASGSAADGRSYEENGKVFLSPVERQLVGAPNVSGGSDETWAKQTLIHELAHTLQSRKTLSSVPNREGGAQAFTDAASPRVLGPVPTNLDSNYTGYVNRVRAKKGNRWIMGGQFR